MKHEYVTYDASAQIMADRYGQAQRLAGMSALLEFADSEGLFWDPHSQAIVELVDTWVDELNWCKRIGAVTRTDVDGLTWFLGARSSWFAKADKETAAAAADDLHRVMHGADDASASLVAQLHGSLTLTKGWRTVLAALQPQPTS